MLIKQNQLVINGTTLEQGDLQAIANVASDVQAQIDTKAPINNAQFTGNVGIGEDSPSAPLVVNATASSEGIRVQRNGVSSQYISIHQATGGDHVIETFGNKALNFGVRDAQPITFKTTNQTRLTITSGGKVGIGETSPLGKLHVKTGDSGATADVSADEFVIEGSGNSGMSILSGTTSTGSIYFGDSDTNWDGYIAYSHNDRKMTLGVAAGGGSVNIDSTGQVGIGTTNPTAKLQVDGTFSVRSSASQYFNDSSNANNLTMTDSKAHFNFDAVDKDFLVSGNGFGHALFVRGSDSKIGIGIGTPDYKVDIDGQASTVGKVLQVQFNDDNNGAANNIYHTSNPNGLLIRNYYSGTPPTAPQTKVAKLTLSTVTNAGYGAHAAMHVEQTGAQDGYNAGHLVFSTGSNSSGLMTEAMRINNLGQTVPKHLLPEVYQPVIDWQTVTGGFTSGCSANTFYPITNFNVNNWATPIASGGQGFIFMIHWTSGNVNRGYHHTVTGHVPGVSANSYIGYQNGSYATSASGAAQQNALPIQVSHHTGCSAGHHIQVRVWGDGSNYGSLYLQIRAEAVPSSSAYMSVWKV